MKIETCGKCEHVRKSMFGRSPIAICGKTEDELIVPHEYRGDGVITFTRVPEFCVNENAQKNKIGYRAKKPDVINVEDITDA